MADNNIVALLEAGLRASSLRGKVIANNIANIDTPGYRRNDVKFEQLLAEAMNGGGKVDLKELRAEVFEPRTTPMNGQGNDVSLDTEIGEMVKNSTTYKVYIRLLNKTYKQMELAMRTQ